jgi:hypothetical protein
MVLKRIGGSYNCRICGGYHSSAVSHYGDKISLTQEIQTLIEDMENTVADTAFKEAARKEIKKLFKELREKLKVPESPIYIGTEYPLKLEISNKEIKVILLKFLGILRYAIGKEAFLSENAKESLKEKFEDFKDDIFAIGRK